MDDDGRVLVDRSLPEHDVDGHAAEEQAHAAGDPLGTGERASPGRVHNGHPDVLVPEPWRRARLEDIAERNATDLWEF